MKPNRLKDNLADTDYEVSADSLPDNESHLTHPWYFNIKYLMMGILFGVLLVKSEVISWYRIQEMFRLQSFHMYGVIGSAVAVGMVSVWVIKKFNVKTIHGEPIVIHPKPFHKGNIYGGLLFGFGWALTGACPGPFVRADRYRRTGDSRNVIQCNRRYLALRLLSTTAPSLIKKGLRRDQFPSHNPNFLRSFKKDR